ncbi:MAG: ROK family protein [Gemmatimonadetes bacterium]|nr:ROK family protein [Gemmatimonadota bacterium]
MTECEGIGLVVPGMVDRRSGRILNSPPLGWRNVDLRNMLAEATGLPTFIENSPIACALAHMWLRPGDAGANDNFVYLSVSDGVGAGVVLDGEVLRGYGETAGELGHIPLSLEGPHCMCGLRGCWEAYTSNIATRARYLGMEASMPENREALRETQFSMNDLMTRARSGDSMAKAALLETGRYLGIGLAGIFAAFSPARIVIGGEITAAWDLIGDTVRHEARQRALTDIARETPILPATGENFPRLRGAAALLVARQFAAPKVA